ncbi:MAG: hypothetical protein ACE5HL_04705 [Terriglobia bacterium]
MNCSEFANLAGAVLEGESHPEAHKHLASCPGCRRLLNELEAIERTARALPTRQPSPGLWERLAAAATQEGLWAQPPWWQSSGPAWSLLLPARPAFAALLGLLLLGVGLVSYPSHDLPLAETAPATPFQVAQGELVQEASYADRYNKHLNNMEDRVSAESGPADAELRGLVAGPLDTVDRAIEETQLRLSSYPDDSLAREELHRLYQQKVTVLQAMADPTWQEVAR